MSSSISYIFKKYKIFYVIAWMFISFIMMFSSYDYRTPLFPQWVGFLIVTGLAIPVCYYSANTLTPSYLYQRRVVKFIGILILAALVNAALTEVIALLIYSVLSGNPPFRSVIYVFALFNQMVLIDTILIIVSCIVKIISDRYFMEQQMLEIEREKISTELNFLRSQVNPHFLFNVMNTIYFQIDKANIDARQSVEKLSEMLRYQLYECTTDKIQIHKELLYIQNYVAIQTLRMEKETDIRLFIEKEMDTFMIAPLLILPIVENAFKHVSTFKELDKNKVHITIIHEGKNILHVAVNNTYDQASGQQHLLQAGGLGMQNLQRRLALLYPGKHELTISKTPDIYQAILKLQYND